MMTVMQYAKKNKISENSARKRLERKVKLGYMVRIRGDDHKYVYYDKPAEIRWHDPFNKIKNCKPKAEDYKLKTEALET
jgi:hypothetical protein